ncbi:MAG: nicotinate (nicotinamide) nucleotide adenylyltransferase [Vicinamibacteria bacterium]|nr:nicotinate (nicotinamide) nucleotide adenylyltransferase [Vicinamibacteria bacterium]
MIRVGLFGGSFDPVHYGHLRAAQWALENFTLTEVRLVPAQQSPFKGPPVASGEDRRAMLTLATSDHESLSVEDCEVRRSAPSYTVDTLRALTSRSPSVSFVLILGSDAAAGVDQWRDAAEVRRLAEIRVLGRPGECPAAGLDAAPFDGLSISSTDIRRAIKDGRSIRYLTPESVRQYIQEKGLYK